MILTFAMGGLQMGFFQIQWNILNDVYVNFKTYDALKHFKDGSGH